MIKAVGFAVVLGAALLPLSGTAAEMSPEDREARCANNLARLAPLEMRYAAYASDEEIARMRTALQSGENDNLDYDRRREQFHRLWDRLKQFSRSGPECNILAPDRRPDYEICFADLRDELRKRIQEAEQQIPQRDALGQEIAPIRERMVELGCAPPRPPSTAQLGWQRAGSGDCPGQDEASSSGAVPDPAMCTTERAGKAAVCWDGSTYLNKYGETHGAPGYPWCTYKSTGSCGGGENTGALYYCRP